MRDALAFLTVLPAGRRPRPPGRAAIAGFPLVGLLVGLLWWGTGRLGTRLWGPAVGAALVLVVDLLVTGGLHLDGLADEADGIASRLPPAEAAAVMRAGPVGAIGAGAAAIVLLLRFALLSTLFAGPLSLAVAAVAIPAAGRFCMVWAMATTRPRRDSAPRRGDRAGLIRALGTPEPGGGPVTRELAVPHGPKGTHAGSLASEMRGAARGLPLLVSGTVTVVSSYLLAGLRGLAGLACACLVASVNAWFAGRRVGGVTGDVVGAGGLLGETVMLAAAAIHL